MNQERKNKQRAIALATLIVVTVAFYLVAFRDSRIEVDETVFKVEDIATVGRVDLVTGADTVMLSFDGTRWRVNNTYEADRQLVKVLFATVDQVRPRRPVGEKVRDSIRTYLNAHGTKVTFYSGGQAIKSYTIGGNAEKTEAWFQDESNGPYVMHIPGYRVYSSGVYEQTVDDWRDKRVFNFNWRNFRKLLMSYTAGKEDFEVTFQDGQVQLTGLPEADTTKLNDFMDNVSFLTAEKYYKKGTSARIDSLMAGPLSFKITVSDIGGKTFELGVFPPMRNESRVFGTANGEDLVFNKGDIIRIAKRRAFFKAETRADL